MDGHFIELGEVRLYYIEKNPTATKTIFFIHGNSSSSNAWRKQWSDPLFVNYRLIVFDLPSHGKSGAMKSSECCLPGLARVLSDAVKQLSGNKAFILAGVSLATNIIGEMLACDITPAAVVLAGPCIVGGEFTLEKMVRPNTHVGVVFRDDASMDEVEAYAKETSLSNTQQDIECFLKDYATVAKPFRSLLAQSISDNQMSNQVELLKINNTPVLMIFGKDEKVVDADYLDQAHLNLWQNKIFKLEGASHLVNIDQPAKFNKLVGEFAEEVFK